MRLAVISPFVDRRHGTERALAELLERLTRIYNCQVHLYAERVEDLALNERGTPSAGEGFIIWRRVPAIAGPHLMKFVAWMISNGLIRWWDHRMRGISFDLVLSPGINSLNPDVVVVHALFHRIRELSGKESAGDRSHIGLFQHFHRRAYYGLLARLERRVYSNRRVLLAAVSRRTADLLAQYFQRSDVHVVRNGVDTQQFCVPARLAGRREARGRRGFRDTDFVLLLIGNDWSVKGLPAVFAAMATMPGLPLRLLVVGNDAPDFFREMARRHGVLDRCRWETPRADVVDLYAAADVYVSPTREDSFGLPVAEAMACGLPVITSDFAGVSALIRNNVDGFVLSDPEDTNTLAQLFQRLHNDTALRSHVGMAAAGAVQDWTWDHHAEAMWKVINVAFAKKNGKRTVPGNLVSC